MQRLSLIPLLGLAGCCEGVIDECEVSDLGAGVYGCAAAFTGDCRPESECCEYVAGEGLAIAAYAASDVRPRGTVACPDAFEVADGAFPVAGTIADEWGYYELPLAMGDYALTSIDPIDACPFYVGEVSVRADALTTNLIVEFDHALRR